MSVHVVVLYTVPDYDQEDRLLPPRECYFEGDVKSADWDGATLKIEKREIHSRQYFYDLWLLGDTIEENLRLGGKDKIDEYCEFCNMKPSREATDILYLKIGDMVLRDIREKEGQP